MSFARYEDRLEASPFAVLATHGRDGRLDTVPCCFGIDASDGQRELVTAVDHKPKRTTKLARLANIERDPMVSLLVDHRNAQDWSQLWWVRAHGQARIVTEGSTYHSALDTLQAKYDQYRQIRPQGPVIRIAVTGWTGWTP